MKETSAKIENEERKYFLAEFSLDDGEYEIIFNIVDINFFAEKDYGSYYALRQDNARYVPVTPR